MLHKKHFSLPEARDLLPEIKIKLSRIIDLKKILDSQGYDIYKHHIFGGINLNGNGKYPSEMKELVELVQLINESGVVIKGLDNGLIDFPYLRENGEEVYLCYLYGEDDINFWHSLDDGFAGRRSLLDL